MALLTQRTSTIFIASGEATRVYRSVEEIPPVLRRKLQQTTRGMNSGTILIADRRGREELLRALQRQRTRIEHRLSETIRTREAPQREKSEKPRRLGSLRTWLELLLPVAIGASLWLFIDSRF